MMLVWLVACASRSPLRADLQEIWSSTQDKAQIFEVLRAREAPFADRALTGRLRRWFRHDPDGLWLAETLLEHGPEPLWTVELLEERQARSFAPGPVRGILGRTAEGTPVEVWFVEGTDPKRALVVGGVHGSEASGIEVVEILVDLLRTSPPPAYTTVLVPSLFPDHAARRLREDPATPTNRNFPEPGTSLALALARGTPVDALGRPILPENLMFISLIERFEPDRLASVHATVREGAAGIFSDLHTTELDASREDYERAGAKSGRDQALALYIARTMAKAGYPGSVPGNHLDEIAVAEWSGGVDGGVSLGGWAPRAVAEGGPGDRPSIGVITVEIDQQHRSDDLTGEEQLARRKELEAMAGSLRYVFLEP